MGKPRVTHPARATALLLSALLGACTSTPSVKLETAPHLSSEAQKNRPAGDVPPPAVRSFALPAPKPTKKQETYSVVVNNVRAQDLLFALARDARVNIDIHPGIEGTVTLNALDQTLPQILTRISRQIDMRYELDGQNLAVLPDSPFLRNYKIDYVNLSRETNSTVSVASQIGSATSIGGSDDSTSAQNSGSGSGSYARIQNISKNRFWESLIQNVKDLLRETDKLLPEGTMERSIQVDTQGSTTRREVTSTTKPTGNLARTAGDTNTVTAATERVVTFREAASVIANVETGVLTVRATSRQQEKVQEFLDKVMNSAKRQVLIEATIAEVQLTQNYQQGVDWSALNVFDTGLKVVQQAVGVFTGVNTTPTMELGYTSSGGNFTSAVKLLETFGTVKVLSSPKLSVLNNQTAVMKVVDDSIYWTYKSETTDTTATSTGRTTITSTLHSVPVGLVLTITPLVGDDDSVTLNIRPSMSRVIGEKTDPTLQLINSSITVTNTIPLIRSREFDSVMRINNGNIAVMGGLMEDALNNDDSSVPGLANIPAVGNIFQNRNDTFKKTELVIFVRPTIIRSASLEGDYRNLAASQPNERFFNQEAGPRLLTLPESGK
ncbi:secretin N-terminal domain-containing protein [Uliginosibacterium sp. IMCC34675]|uniref:Secretin N-terminal domain-containing protein n=1 Tax=Uliginosibacterium aquaticum TaxID=2731212 RepID=A0ABX2INP8_9RHOO|nr:secretin N-terminal domain-containing protein [Uliginosibacterium aquaticum]